MVPQSFTVHIFISNKQKLTRHRLSKAVKSSNNCSCSHPWIQTRSGCYFKNALSCKNRHGKARSSISLFFLFSSLGGLHLSLQIRKFNFQGIDQMFFVGTATQLVILPPNNPWIRLGGGILLFHYSMICVVASPFNRPNVFN